MLFAVASTAALRSPVSPAIARRASGSSTMTGTGSPDFDDGFGSSDGEDRNDGGNTYASTTRAATTRADPPARAMRMRRRLRRLRLRAFAALRLSTTMRTTLDA